MAQEVVDTVTLPRGELLETISRRYVPIVQDTAVEKFLTMRLQLNSFLIYPGASFEDLVYRKNNSVIYKKKYHTDKFLRRTPQINNNQEKHFIIAGDSNIFGLGANDDETLSAYLALNFKDRKIYNLGMPGSGPNSLLYLLENFSIPEDLGIKEKKGMMIYDFNFYLLERITGSVNCIEWCKNFPYYRVDKNNNLLSDGIIENHWFAQFYLLLKSFPYSEKLFPNFPKISKDHLELAASILEAIQNKYHNQTGSNNQFYVSINPNAARRVDSKIQNEMINLLKKRKINVLTFPSIYLKFYEEDGHIAPEGHKLYAESFKKALNESSNK